MSALGWAEPDRAAGGLSGAEPPRAAGGLKVLVDATPLGDDSAYRGIGTYLRHLLAALGEIDELELTGLVRPGTRLPAGVNVAPVRRGAPGRWQRIEHELRLPLDLRAHPADVVHSPALDPPLRCAAPWVQTLHDVIPLVYDTPDLGVERRRWKRHAPRYRRASGVVAVSRHTADVGIRELGLDPRRVEVIPHGVGPEFTPAPPAGPGAAPYLLMVGEYSERKGYREAFAVIGELARLGYPHMLRVTGRIVPWVRPRLDALVAAAPAPDRIELLGFVDDLVAAYRGATALIMSSRYEGFGFPVLEAMACGVPVISFDNSSLTELVGTAGVLVPDGDVPAMVRAVRAVIEDPARANELRDRGLEHARAFSWQRSAQGYAEMYARAGASR